jgi:hypothetical protein
MGDLNEGRRRGITGGLVVEYVPVTGTFSVGARDRPGQRAWTFIRGGSADASMGLSDIAAGITVTAEQDERGVPTVDESGSDLVSRLEPHADALPCAPEAAATVLETHTAGTSVGESARTAGVAPVTAAKVLHRCGVAGVSPLSPAGREVVRDWQAGRVSRTTARELVDGDEAAFALAAYVESHDPVPALASVAESVLTPNGTATVEKRDALAGTMSSVTDLR